MSRKVTAAALALTLAGGVYLAGTPAEASNMGFKLERSFDQLRDPNPPNRAFPNVYWASFPLFNGLGDVANTASPLSNKCVGDTVGGGGPLAGDGLINMDDAICDMWTGRTGGFQLNFYDETGCSPVARTASVIFGGTITFQSAGPPAPMPADVNNDARVDPGVGYEIILTGTGSQVNRAVIVGSHDPSFPGQPLVYSTTCGTRAQRRQLLNIPYHTMLGTLPEIICGLEGVDWFDDGAGGGTAGDGLPDTASDCVPPAAIFDGQQGNAHGIQVETFINEVGQAPGPVSVSVSIGFGNVFSVFGAPTPIRPGDAYRVTLSASHQPTNFLSPHF